MNEREARIHEALDRQHAARMQAALRAQERTFHTIRGTGNAAIQCTRSMDPRLYHNMIQQGWDPKDKDELKSQDEYMKRKMGFGITVSQPTKIMVGASGKAEGRKKKADAPRAAFAVDGVRTRHGVGTRYVYA